MSVKAKRREPVTHRQRRAPVTHRQKLAGVKRSPKMATENPFAARDMLLAIAKEFESLPPGAWNKNRPRDMAKNLDHYLYGLSKEQEERK